MPSERFPMRLDPLWRPLLLIGGAMRGNSYVELSDETLDMRFGWFTHRSIRRDTVTSAAETSWPMWGGIGWRALWGRRYGLIGSTSGVVELRLRNPLRVWPLNFRSVAISLEEPQRFLAALAVPTSD